MGPIIPREFLERENVDSAAACGADRIIIGITGTDAVLYLDSLFLEVHGEGQLLAEEHVRVVSLKESRLQFLQLLLGEDGPVAALALSAGCGHR